MGKYIDLFQKSIEDPEGFWSEATQAITSSKKWDKVLDDSNRPFSRWFSGGGPIACPRPSMTRRS